MEEELIQNRQNISGGQGWQVNDPTAPIVQGNNNTINIVNHPPLQSEPKVSGTPHNLPYSGAIAFVGRDEDLKRLHEQLQTETTITISSISGMGGIGKTELAWQYANHQLVAEPPLAAVCWLRAREDLGAQILSFGQSKLGLKVPQEWEFAQQVSFCWDQLRQSESLVIFDDVQKFEDVKSFLAPVPSRCKILLTTRARFGQAVQSFEIKVLKEAQALDLLRVLAADGRIDADLETAKQICRWLGCLPLGLELVGQYLKQKTDTSVAKLWERLQAKRLDAIALKQAAPGMTAELGVAAAFELSWQELDGQAQRVAAFLSLFALAEIPWGLVQAGLLGEDEEELEEVRDRQLVELSLLTRTGQGMYELHQLLREFFAVKREQMPEDKAMKRSFCEVVVEVAEKIPQTVTLAVIENAAPAIPHIKEAATTLSSWLNDDKLIMPSSHLGWFYEGQSAFEEAEEWYLHCLKISSQRFGKDHSFVAMSLNNLAGLYRSKGCYEKAVLLVVQSLEIWQRHLGKDHLNIATSLNNLAELFCLQGWYEKAELLYLESLEIRQKKLEKDHLDVAFSLNNLAELYRLQGRYGEAASLHMRSLGIKQRWLGENHPSVATSLNNLANLYRSQERYEEAKLLYIQAMQVDQQTLGQDHPDFAVDLNNLAGLYASLECYAEAEMFYLQAIAIFNQQLGETHPNTQIAWQEFVNLLQEVIQSDRISELSDNPITRSLLQKLQNTSE